MNASQRSLNTETQRKPQSTPPSRNASQQWKEEPSDAQNKKSDSEEKDNQGSGSQKVKLTKSVEKITRAVGCAAKDLERETYRRVSGTVEKFADRVQAFSEKVSDASPAEWLGMIKNYSKGHTKTLYLGMFLLGLGAASLIEGGMKQLNTKEKNQ